MPWINPEGKQYSSLPKRIRLDDKTTRTSDAVTEEVAIAAGWRWEEPQQVIWTVPEEQIVYEVPQNISEAVFVDSNSTVSNITI